MRQCYGIEQLGQRAAATSSSERLSERYRCSKRLEVTRLSVMTDGVQHSFDLFADYFQFYLQDDDCAAGVDGGAWTPEAMTARVANGDRFVAIGAARNLEVPVTVELTDSSPEIDAAASHVVEADLVVSTGRVVVAGCTDEFERAARIPVEAGRYRVRVTYRLRSADDDGFGDYYDYVVDLWPTNESSARRVVVQGPEPWAG